ncbi:HPr family phosphocarrier protein [Acuticoccus sediminis]|uniref:Phosphocarrier protein HPr n=2 Tax=Acuticoccus sediminis TaxID=2184697 RepID=A0A8B2NRT7_9HYPH|nr:HPr family phosphocarrier protein [Acuticoccus sediminis]
MGEWIEGAATIVDPTGLHARPAVKLTKLAKTFGAVVEVRADTDATWTNAKSPNSVMKMKAAHGSPLHIRASGEDADAAVAALVALVERNFDA